VIFRRRRHASGTHSRGKEAPPSRLRRWIAGGLALASLAVALHAGWMPAKAALAQELLHASWSQSLADGGEHRPWPWADTHPVAQIVQPRLGVSQVVLAGDSGRTLAFGPGWAPASATPGSLAGTVVISGHRDTHFAWLQHLHDGDRLRLETPQGPRDFVVMHTQVVDSRLQRLDTTGQAEQLVLVTCWPFDATAPRGPMRYVVTLASLEVEALAADLRG
jgi:sortase A